MEEQPKLAAKRQVKASRKALEARGIDMATLSSMLLEEKVVKHRLAQAGVTQENLAELDANKAVDALLSQVSKNYNKRSDIDFQDLQRVASSPLL